MAGKKKPPVVVDEDAAIARLTPTKIIQLALELPANARDKLLAALLDAAAPSPHYEVFKKVFTTELHVGLMCTPGSAMHKHLIAICTRMTEMGFGSGDTRQEYAVLVCAVRAAAKHAERSGRAASAPTVLSILAEASWSDLLDGAFPGYGTNLLGGLLCRQASSTSPLSLPPTD